MVHSVVDVSVALGDFNKGILPYSLPLGETELEILHKKLFFIMAGRNVVRGLSKTKLKSDVNH